MKKFSNKATQIVRNQQGEKHDYVSLMRYVLTRETVEGLTVADMLKTERVLKTLDGSDAKNGLIELEDEDAKYFLGVLERGRFPGYQSDIVALYRELMQN